jgi:hypothetical protein
MIFQTKRVFLRLPDFRIRMRPDGHLAFGVSMVEFVYLHTANSITSCLPFRNDYRVQLKVEDAMLRLAKFSPHFQCTRDTDRQELFSGLDDSLLLLLF